MKYNDRIEIRLLAEEDFFPLMECHVSAFATDKGEAMMQALDLTLAEAEAFARPVCEKAIAEQMSLLAWDKERHRIAGFCLNEPFATIPNYASMPLPQKLLPLYQFLKVLDAHCLAEVRHSTSKILHLVNLGVLRDYRRAGVAQALLIESLELGKERGFEYAVAECTGHGSQTLCDGLGFQPLKSLNYADFEHDGSHPFRAIVDPPMCRLVGITI